MITGMNQSALTRIGIVADDLTSATDGAAPFMVKGFAPLITQRDAGPVQAALVAIDTNSRAMTATRAAAATMAAVSALCDRAILFKTIDSTLRGHAREEIAAALQASGRSRLVIAPAFPDAGRLTIDGIQLVHGIPVSDSDYGSDPVHPARTSQISHLIDPSLGSAIVVPAKASPDAIRQAAKARIVILDADSQAALNEQVACVSDPESVLWIGSPGLAIALASLVPATPDRHQLVKAPSGRTLIVAGSANPITHAQCSALQDAGIAVVEDIAKAPADVPIVCMRAPQQRQEDASSVLDNIVGQAVSALALKTFGIIIATGGETMAAILERLGISRFLLVRELEPGFPVGLAELPDGTPLTIAMKAGGFGTPATLLHGANVLASTMELAR